MDQIIVVVYLVCIFALGIWGGKGVKTLSQFSVAGRSYGTFIIFATLSASFIGGGFSMGNAEKVFLFGIVNIFALWGFSLKEILVASFIAPRMGKYPDAISVGDIMKKNYGKTGMVVSGIMAFAVCAGILGAQVGATGYIFNIFLGIPRFHSILIGCGIVIAYSTVGVMRSVVLTDVVQFVILAIGIPLTLILGINHVGGWSVMISSVPNTHFTFPGTGKTMAQFIALFLAFVFGETLVPPYVQRLFLSKKSSHTVKATLFSGIFSIPFFAVTGFIGIVALTIKPDLDPNSAMPFVISTVLPIGLKGLVIAGVISIVMSSADSFLNSASIAITHDVVEPLRKKRMSVSRELLFVRVINLFTGVVAIIFAVKIKSILDILLYSYNFWSPIILVPLTLAILGLKTDVRHFVAGALSGVLGVAIWNFVLKNPGGLDGLIIGLFCNFIVMMGYYLLGRSKEAIQRSH
ncbi:MAG: sodium:solute symporter family protein [Candidatus Scalindua sp.]|nr:sodium:solute symporter family protein [Candidatus Scalindua sp.]